MSEVLGKATVEKWTQITYELLSFQLTDQFVAVFAEVADDGLTDLFPLPLDAIGLARITTRFVEGVRGIDGHWRETEDPDIYNNLVGLQLEDGYWLIANEWDNFSGIAKAGAQIADTHGCLDRNNFRKLRPKSAE